MVSMQWARWWNDANITCFVIMAMISWRSCSQTFRSTYHWTMDIWYTWWSKKLAHFCTPYTFVKYWPISNVFFSLSESVATKDPTTPHVSLHYLVKCQCLKATIENKTTSVTTNFKELTTVNCHIMQFLHQIFNLSSCCYRSRLVFNGCY